MKASLLLLVAAFGQLAAEAPSSPGRQAGGDPTYSSFTPGRQAPAIKADKDITVFAEAEGILDKLLVREGSRVAAGQVLASIDARQANAAVKAAKLGYEAALQKAKDNIEELYAIAAAKVAKADLEMSLAANRDSPNAVSGIEVLQKQLVVDRSRLQTDKARKDQVIAAKEADVKQAEYEAANVQLEHRTIKSRFDGQVEQLFQKEGQWVNPGEPILRLVQFDVMHVECYVSARDFDPIDLTNRRVTVRVHLANEREASLTGQVIHVSQTVVSNDYLVRAEVKNQRNGEYWLLRPGMDAELTIHVSQPPVDAPVKETAQK